MTTLSSTADSPSTDWSIQSGIGLESPGPGASSAVDTGPSFGNQVWTGINSMSGGTTWDLSVYFFHSGVNTSSPISVGITTDKSNTYVGTGSPQHSIGFFVESDRLGLQRSDGSTSSVLYSNAFSSNLVAGNWYQLSFTATPQTSGGQFLRFSDAVITNSDAAGNLGSVFDSPGFPISVFDNENITLDSGVYIYMGGTSGTLGITALDNLSTTATIPEPSTYAMIAALCAFVLVSVRRQLLQA